MAENRVCKKCGKEKSIDAFYTRKSNGLVYHRHECKECNIKKSKIQRENMSLEKQNFYANRWRRRNRISSSLAGIRHKAKLLNYAPCTASKDEIKLAFTGKCHVCGIPEVECKTRLHIDHDHETGMFRGWLCSNCNAALGMLRNSSDIILNLALYLEKSEENVNV